jgi:hypothetical protein
LIDGELGKHWRARRAGDGRFAEIISRALA